MASSMPADRAGEPGPRGRLRRHGAALRARAAGPRLRRPGAARPRLPPAHGRAARPGLAGGDADRGDGARPRGGRGLPAQPLDDLPRAASSPSSSASRPARWPRSCAATSSASTATTTGACATSSTRPSRRAPPTAGGPPCGPTSSSSGTPSRADGRCEFVEAFAKPYPSLVIATVMGAPLTDAPRLHHWSNWIQKQFDAEALMTERALIEEAVVEFYDYADALLAARREDPGEDLVSTLLAAEADGDRLSEVECVNLVLNVLIGGVDTTQSQLAHAIRLLAEHPDQWDALHADPSLAAGRGRGGAALRADHALHGAHRGRGHGGARRRLPGGHGRAGGRLHGQPRRARGPRPLRHHAHRRRAPDDLRRRASTTAWARTSRAPSCRRASASSPRASSASSSTASRSTAA